jgi:hypothetical protein
MKPKSNAFSRVDLLLCLFSVTLIFLMAASLFASNKSDSQRVICFNNLRQIGRAFHVWGNDYEDQLPWQVGVSLGGTGNSSLGIHRWWQYSWISNQLGSPRALACPADPAVSRLASNWSLGADGGFLNPSYRNNAVSYPIFLHAQPSSPRSFLAADRNIRVDSRSSGCSYLTPPVCFQLFSQGVGTWTNAVHGTAGHLLLMDESVSFTTPTEFRRALFTPGQDDNGSIHGL